MSSVCFVLGIVVVNCLLGTFQLVKLICSSKILQSESAQTFYISNNSDRKFEPIPGSRLRAFSYLINSECPYVAA